MLLNITYVTAYELGMTYENLYSFWILEKVIVSVSRNYEEHDFFNHKITLLDFYRFRLWSFCLQTEDC